MALDDQVKNKMRDISSLTLDCKEGQPIRIFIEGGVFLVGVYAGVGENNKPTIDRLYSKADGTLLTGASNLYINLSGDFPEFVNAPYGRLEGWEFLRGESE